MAKKSQGPRVSALNHSVEGLQYAVRKSGLTNTSIAEQLGMAKSTFSQIFHGDRSLTQPNLERLAVILNCPTVVLEAKIHAPLDEQIPA